jgi:hypothetical protein
MSKLSILMDAITHLEGGDRPGTLPTRLNNPGDLMFARQAGAIAHPVKGADGKTRVFAEFPTLEAGRRALAKQIGLNASRGDTLAQFIGHYAPASDGNNESAYLRGVMKSLGETNPNRKLADVLADA